jgi:hypothetical protein
VAQKLVAIESFKAKIASGAISAAQNLSSPLLVPKIKIEASGKKHQRHHHEDEHADAERPNDVETANMTHGWNDGTHLLLGLGS